MSSQASEIPLARRFGGALNLAQHALRTRLDEALRPIGLTTPQCALLSALEREPGMSNASLARAAFVTPQTMQSILANLERDGLVIREADPDHGRILRSSITLKGRRALMQAHTAILSVEAMVMEAVGEKEAERLTRVLTRCAELLLK
jgi:DNA-binding MarR family transcriptional regulator